MSPKSTVEKVLLFNIKEFRILKNKTPICCIPKVYSCSLCSVLPLCGGVIIADLLLCQSSLCFVFKVSGFSQASGAVLLGHSQYADTLPSSSLRQKSFLYRLTSRHGGGGVSAEGWLVTWLRLFWGSWAVVAFVKTASSSDPQKKSCSLWLSFLNTEQPTQRWVEELHGCDSQPDQAFLPRQILVRIKKIHVCVFF